MKSEQVPPAEVDALTSMEFAVKAAERLSESANAYLQAIQSAPRVAVEVGGFYRTFDGSTVHVSRIHTKCECPACTGRQFSAIGGIIFGTAQILEPESAAEHKEAEGPEKRRYVVTLLRGGHGITELPGEKAGENYLVDCNGLTLVGNPATARNYALSRLPLALAGLSLRARLIASLTEASS